MARNKRAVGKANQRQGKRAEDFIQLKYRNEFFLVPQFGEIVLQYGVGGKLIRATRKGQQFGDFLGYRISDNMPIVLEVKSSDRDRLPLVKDKVGKKGKKVFGISDSQLKRGISFCDRGHLGLVAWVHGGEIALFRMDQFNDYLKANDRKSIKWCDALCLDFCEAVC